MPHDSIAPLVRTFTDAALALLREAYALYCAENGVTLAKADRIDIHTTLAAIDQSKISITLRADGVYVPLVEINIEEETWLS